MQKSRLQDKKQLADFGMGSGFSCRIAVLDGQGSEQVASSWLKRFQAQRK
jgi:hypothetical protein